MKHAKYFSPSSNHRNIVCPASVRLNADLEGKESLPAAEGTVAHYVAERCMKEDIPPQSVHGEWFYYMGQGEVSEDPIDGLDAMWEFECDEEMVVCLSGYIAHCNRRPGKHFVELTVDISEYCPIPDQFGTSDHISIDEPGCCVYVDDLKYGKGIKVAPQENWQAISYALGTLMWLKKKHPKIFAKMRTVVIGIYQPRLDNIDEWITTVEHILQLGEYMRERFALAWAPNPPFNPDAKACQWCKVVPCKAEASYISDKLIEGLDGTENVTADVIDSTFLLDPSEAEALYLRKSWYENFFRKLHDYLFKMIADNKPATFLRMGESRGKRVWISEDEAVRRLMEMGVEKIHTTKVASPAQAEKQLKKKQRDEIQSLIRKIPGAPRLVPIRSDHKDYGADLIDGLDNLDGDDLGID